MLNHHLPPKNYDKSLEYPLHTLSVRNEFSDSIYSKVVLEELGWLLMGEAIFNPVFVSKDVLLPRGDTCTSSSLFDFINLY